MSNMQDGQEAARTGVLQGIADYNFDERVHDWTDVVEWERLITAAHRAGAHDSQIVSAVEQFIQKSCANHENAQALCRAVVGRLYEQHPNLFSIADRIDKIAHKDFSDIDKKVPPSGWLRHAWKRFVNAVFRSTPEEPPTHDM